MDQRTEERIEGWETKPLTGGFAELRELADGGFSGVARTGRTTLFMLNGRVVGVVGGSIEDFERGEATVAKAPHPSLPLLFAMKERGGEQQAKYYTNDTPISEAHEQLREAGFTGFIELSENVLSGDYYVVYQGGRSLSCAFVGNAERLKTGDEAFELADDEVGIYEVISVDLDVVDIPEPGGADAAGGAGAAGSGAGPGAGEVGRVGGGGGTAPGGRDDAAPAGHEQDVRSAGERDHPREAGADPDTRGTTGEDPGETTGSRAAGPRDDHGGGAAGPRDDHGGGAAGPRDDRGGGAAGPRESAAGGASDRDRSTGGRDRSTEPPDGDGRSSAPGDQGRRDQAGDDTAADPREGDDQAGHGPREATGPGSREVTEPGPDAGRQPEEGARRDPADGVGPGEREAQQGRPERAGGGHGRPSDPEAGDDAVGVGDHGSPETNPATRRDDADPATRRDDADHAGAPGTTDAGRVDEAPSTGEAEIDRADEAAQEGAASPESTAGEPAARGDTAAGPESAPTDGPAGGDGATEDPPSGAAAEGASGPASAAAGDAANDGASGATGESAADRAVEAATGDQGSSANGAASAGEGVPKEAASFGELRAIPSLSPDHTAVAEVDHGAGGGRDEPEPTAEAEATEMSSGSIAEDAGATGSVAEDAGTTGSVAEDVGTADAASSAVEDSAGSSAADAPPETTGDRDPNGSTAAGNAGVPEGGSVGSGTGGAEDRPGTDVTERASQAVDVEPEEPPAPADDEAGDEPLREELAAREQRIEELEAAITDLRVQRDGLTDERDRLQEEVERLQGEVAELEAEIERLRGQLDDGADGKQRLSPDEALGATNLFVRYDSKSGGTLEDAHAGEVESEEVNENLRLEHHTQFDAAEAVVGDQPFEAFLEGTVFHEFVEWIVRDLLYEIQNTGHVKGLAELYDAIPKIDRAELFGDVAVRFTEDGEEYREQRSFDVVLRDRMGNPLIVANLNDSRTPADREMMEAIIQNAIDVKESNESLSSAMLVTASFFKPGALEAADETQGGGLLSRESKESYVRLNRKSGYHLVLVESREGDFHVNVPEL